MKKGFTLIELLAVIVILAIIAVIAVPLIFGIIEKVKKSALGSTANGLMDSAEVYYAKNLEETGENKVFLFDDSRNGETVDGEKISYKGSFEGTGSVRLYSNGKTAICITDGKYYALKNVSDNEVKTGTGTCSYDSETESYLSLDLVSQELVDNLQEQISSLTNDLNNLNSLGDSTPSDILVDKTAVVKGNLITGTKTDKVLKIYTFADDNIGNTTVRSINVSAIVQNFSSLTVDNLVLEARSSSNNLNTRNMTFFKTYNSSTGIYTYYVVGANLNNDTLFTKVTPKLYYVE